MGIEQIAAWLIDLIPAFVIAGFTAWATAWAYSRRETDRLAKVWRREHEKEKIDSLKQYLHQLLQNLTVADRPLMWEEAEVEPVDGVKERDLEASRALVSAAVSAMAIGDEEITKVGDRLSGYANALMVNRDEEARDALVQSIGLMLKRCYEMLEEKDDADKDRA